MEQLSFSSAPDGGMSGEEMNRRATNWVYSNFYAWNRMKDIARERVADGKRFSIDELAIEVRYRMKTEGKDAGYKFNNTLRAALARRLLNEVPDARPFLEIRASRVDFAKGVS